jgi:hypothetical protein
MTSRMKKRSPSSYGQNGEPVHWWALIYSGHYCTMCWHACMHGAQILAWLLHYNISKKGATPKSSISFSFVLGISNWRITKK